VNFLSIDRSHRSFGKGLSCRITGQCAASASILVSFSTRIITPHFESSRIAKYRARTRVYAFVESTSSISRASACVARIADVDVTRLLPKCWQTFPFFLPPFFPPFFSRSISLLRTRTFMIPSRGKNFRRSAKVHAPIFAPDRSQLRHRTRRRHDATATRPRMSPGRGIRCETSTREHRRRLSSAMRGDGDGDAGEAYHGTRERVPSARHSPLITRAPAVPGRDVRTTQARARSAATFVNSRRRPAEWAEWAQWAGSSSVAAIRSCSPGPPWRRPRARTNVAFARGRNSHAPVPT